MPLSANLFRLESSILTQVKRATNRNNVGGNIPWGNIPGCNVPRGIFRGRSIPRIKLKGASTLSPRRGVLMHGDYFKSRKVQRYVRCIQNMINYTILDVSISIEISRNSFSCVFFNKKNIDGNSTMQAYHSMHICDQSRTNDAEWLSASWVSI